MKRAIFIHGYYAKEKFFNPDDPTWRINFKDFVPWLLKNLEINGYLAYNPVMPWPYWPVYEDWARELDRYDADENTVIIGHSYGGGFLVRYLSERDVKVGKVILIEPYLGIEDGNRVNQKSFFDYEIDENLATKTAGLTVMMSTGGNDPDDHELTEKSYDFLQANVKGFKTVTIEDRGHFTVSTAGAVNETFPELLEEILR